MKIKIEFEIPNWTRWIAAGLIAGVAIGFGMATVRAAPVSVTHTWNTGDALTAAALNKNFQDLQDAINAQQAALDAMRDPDCPTGYARDSNTTAYVVCKRGSDEIVKVDVGTIAFWIDRYEASIWDHSDGSGTQYGMNTTPDFPPEFPVSGQYSTPFYAISMAGVHPAGQASWFQAQAACELSGKRLPTYDEWLRAARGTIDRGASAGLDGSCVTDSPSVRNTGAGKSCVSRWGAEDMIGNVAEFTRDWSTGNTTAGCADWPGFYFNSDIICVTATNYPVAPSMGGSLFNAAGAGVFTMDLSWSPDFQDFSRGFRCVIGR